MCDCDRVLSLKGCPRFPSKMTLYFYVAYALNVGERLVWIYNCATLRHLFTEFRSCVKVEVAVLGSLSVTVLLVSADVKHH